MDTRGRQRARGKPRDHPVTSAAKNRVQDRRYGDTQWQVKVLQQSQEAFSPFDRNTKINVCKMAHGSVSVKLKLPITSFLFSIFIHGGFGSLNSF